MNGALCRTFKEACYALGLLNNDKEWNAAVLEASQWASTRKLRELFVTITMFCEVFATLLFWQRNAKLFSEDILYKKRKLFKHSELILSYEQILTYCLVEIEKLLNKNGESLKDFEGPPQLELEEIKHLDSILICEQLMYDVHQLRMQHNL